MKTAYLNPYGQSALEIIHNYGNITQITQPTQEINNIIEHTYNQERKHVNTIKELCYEKIRQYYQGQTNKKSNSYNYLFTEAIDNTDTIATHTLLQTTAINYGSDSYEADLITQIITNTTIQRLANTNDELLDETLSDYIDINNTTLTDILPLIQKDSIKLNNILLNKNKVILTYTDFLEEFSEYLQHRRPEIMYNLLCTNSKKDILTALIEQQTHKYMQTIEEKLKQVEPAPIIQELGKEIKQIEVHEREAAIKQQYGKNRVFTNYNDDQPTAYIPEAFPPCVQKALNGIKSGGRNYCISLFLTPFLSYARLYPGVYARHIKNAKITDMDPTLIITQEEIIPLIHQAANNCKPPLFKDQPQEIRNIHSKLGFGENDITYENSGKTPWYTPMNCQNIKNSHPELCTPCMDCKKIGNPLSYYNRKRKILTKQGGKKDDNVTTSNQG